MGTVPAWTGLIPSFESFFSVGTSANGLKFSTQYTTGGRIHKSEKLGGIPAL